VPRAYTAGEVRWTLLTLLRRNSDLLLALVLTVVAGYAGFSAYGGIRFDRERIEVWVAPGQVQVTGLYHYRNPSYLPALLSLGVPFPVDADHPQPTACALSDADTQGDALQPIFPGTKHGELRFRVLLMPREERWIRLDYVQASRVPRATYILRTTRGWRRPLEAGNYILHLCPGLELASSSYPVAAEREGRTMTYSFARNNFYPDEDWVFSWRDAGTVRASGSAP